MDKPFKSYRQQLSILRKRNVSIPLGWKAKKAITILKNEGYYNVINGYKDVFLESGLNEQSGAEEIYKDGTTLEHIYALYNFDKNIGLIILKYILKMEISLKTKIAYCFSKAYRQDFNYLNINNFDTENINIGTQIISELSNVISKRTKSGDKEQKNKGQQEERFYHYLRKHGSLPLWVLVTKMTLGNTIQFYNAMKMDDKLCVIKEIVGSYQKEYSTNINISELEQEAYISNMFAVINDIRNICAHEERLYSIRIKSKGKKPGKIILFHKSELYEFNACLIDCIIILGLFIKKKDYNQMVSNLEKEIKLLSKELPADILRLILNKMGFPVDWKSKLKLP